MKRITIDIDILKQDSRISLDECRAIELAVNNDKQLMVVYEPIKRNTCPCGCGLILVVTEDAYITYYVPQKAIIDYHEKKVSGDRL